MKTIEHLEQLGGGRYGRLISETLSEHIGATEDELTKKGRTWLLIMTAGVMGGYMDYADFFEGGRRTIETSQALRNVNPGPFWKQMETARNSARSMWFQLDTQIQAFQKSTDEKIPPDFAFPNGGANRPPALVRVSTGVMAADTEIELAQKAAIKRAVLLEVCRAMGAKEDPAKAAEIFKAGNVQVLRNAFVLMLTNDLHRLAQLLSKEQMNGPEQSKGLCVRAQEIIKPLPDSKEKQELEKAIAATIKVAELVTTQVARSQNSEVRMSTVMFPGQASCLKRSASCWRPIRRPF